MKNILILLNDDSIIYRVHKVRFILNYLGYLPRYNSVLRRYDSLDLVSVPNFREINHFLSSSFSSGDFEILGLFFFIAQNLGYNFFAFSGHAAD